MKKLVLNCLMITALAASSAAFASFNDNGKEAVKLVETTIYSDGSYTKFEYDVQNRITKISEYDKIGAISKTETIIYSGNDLVRSVAEGDHACANYVKNDNQITIKYYDNDRIYESWAWNDACEIFPLTIYLSNDGYPTNYKGSMYCEISYSGNYTIQNGNVTVHTYESSSSDGSDEGSNNYNFDDKKSPFYHCATPKWWMIRNLTGYYGKNNVTEIYYGSGKKKFTYVYDEEGYPTKRTTILFDNNEAEYEPEEDTGESMVIEFKYVIRSGSEEDTMPSTTSGTTTLTTMDNEPAVLHIYRKRKTLEILPRRYEVLLDNAVVGNTTANWKTTVPVNTFGIKTISATIDGRKAEVRINFVPGGVYYLRSEVDSKTVDTGKTRTYTDRNGKTTTSKVTEIQYTPILQLVDKRVGESEFKAIVDK